MTVARDDIRDRPSPTEQAAVLAASSLTLARGRRIVLRDVELALCRGEIVHLSGANGSGKTTLLRALAGVRPPRRGSVDATGARAYVPEKVVLAPGLRCGEWLRSVRALRGLAPVDWEAAVAESGLEPAVIERPTGTLSKGMLQRIALLEALRSRSAVLLLDEPFSGLDRDGRAWLADAVAGAAAGGACVVLTEHASDPQQHLPVSRALRLAGGRCEAVPVTAAPIVTVRASHADGRRISRGVADEEVDALLRELLGAGWHVEEVRR